MIPNPSNFLDFSPARKLMLGILPTTLCATPASREPQQPQARGEAANAFEGAFSTLASA
jgi:hypothetical protein